MAEESKELYVLYMADSDLFVTLECKKEIYLCVWTSEENVDIAINKYEWQNFEKVNMRFQSILEVCQKLRAGIVYDSGIETSGLRIAEYETLVPIMEDTNIQFTGEETVGEDHVMLRVVTEVKDDAEFWLLASGVTDDGGFTSVFLTEVEGIPCLPVFRDKSKAEKLIKESNLSSEPVKQKFDCIFLNCINLGVDILVDYDGSSLTVIEAGFSKSNIPRNALCMVAEALKSNN